MTSRVPTLFVGIGGIGCKIVAGISDRIKNPEDRKFVSFVGVDTDVNDLGDRQEEKHQMEFIQTSGDWSVSDYLEHHKQDETWFPTEPILKMRSMTDGAGQVRSLSRLAFLAAVENHAFDKLFTEIKRIREVNSGLHKDLVIVIIGSITGGTGAGMFIQLPFLIRQKLLLESGANKFIIRGMFVGSDITAPVQDLDDNKDNVHVNAYACMKELNAFNIHHIVSPEIAGNLNVDFYESSDTKPSNVPYDYLYLFENSSKKGTVGNLGLPEMINYISDIAYSLLFTKVSTASRSIEDNQILGFIRQNALNRYAAAGICKLIYPYKDAQEYVTLYNINQLVKQDWIILDERYRNERKVALEQAEIDLEQKAPELRDVYVREFEKDSQGNALLLTKFNAEAYDRGPNDEYISKAVDFVDQIEKRIMSEIESTAVEEAQKSCKVNSEAMRSADEACEQVSHVWNAMKKFVDLAETMKREKPIGIANDFYPTSKADLKLKRDKQIGESHRIYDYLSNVHPVVGRYLIYSIINILSEKVENYKNQLNGVKLLEYKEEDFDPKTTKTIETPVKVVNSIKDKYDSDIWNLLGPIGNYAEEKALKKLRLKLSSVADTHINTVTNYIEYSLKVMVEETILKRVKLLAKKYEEFFDTIEKNIKNNDDRMKAIEEKYYPFGTKGIYCSKEAFIRMSQEFAADNKENLQLSPETKNAIFNELINLQLEDEEKKRQGITETEAERKKRVNASKKAMGDVFKNAIENTIHHIVEENGDTSVNLCILDALEKEYALLSDEKTSLEMYIKQRIDEAYEIATPMITTTSDASNGIIKFLALSGDNAKGNNDVIATEKFYVNPANHQHVNVIINDDFDDDEIVVVTLSYGYLIENLVKYGPLSNNAVEYNKRITNLINNTISNPEVEVNPHLNRYWHEEGFIPSLLPDQRKKDHKDHIEAFVMGLGYDWFKMAPYKDKVNDKGERVLKWESCVNGQFRKIKKCDQLIGNNYSDLYDSLLYNASTKKYVLASAEKRLKKFKGNNTAAYIADNLLDYELVIDWAQPKTTGVDKETDTEEPNILWDNANIFDVFLSMFSIISIDEWESLVNGFYDVIWEKLNYLFDNNTDLVEKKTKAILEFIYKNSSLTKRSADYNEGEYKLYEIYKSLIEREYE